jgi:hypothetical protein
MIEPGAKSIEDKQREGKGEEEIGDRERWLRAKNTPHGDVE